MNCKECSNVFNDKANIPQLLPKCGHTICAECVYSLFGSGQVSCPECKTVNFAELPVDFPRNQTLLDLNKGTNSISNVSKPTEKKVLVEDLISIDEAILQHLNSNTILEHKSGKYGSGLADPEICKIHLKEYEAYCMEDRSLLCVQCLLERKHNNHKVYNIEDSYTKTKANLGKRITEFEEQNGFLLENFKNGLDGVLEEITKQYKTGKEKVELQFNELVEVIYKRKKEVLAQLKYVKQFGL